MSQVHCWQASVLISLFMHFKHIVFQAVLIRDLIFSPGEPVTHNLDLEGEYVIRFIGGNYFKSTGR